VMKGWRRTRFVAVKCVWHGRVGARLGGNPKIG
jgi:hypothetical protein